MRKIYAILILFLISVSLLAQTTYTSVQNGNWNNPNTWDNGVPSGSGAVVVIDHEVDYTNVGFFAAFGSLTINAAGKLNNSGGILLFRYVTIEGEYKQFNSNASLIRIGGNSTVNGTYNLNYNGATMPDKIDWGDNSLLKISGATTSFSTDLPANTTPKNLEIDCGGLATEVVSFELDLGRCF